MMRVKKDVAVAATLTIITAAAADANMHGLLCKVASLRSGAYCGHHQDALVHGHGSDFGSRTGTATQGIVIASSAPSSGSAVVVNVPGGLSVATGGTPTVKLL